MTVRDPGWELYRSLLAVLRQGSLSAAARTLGVTQPTIGRHIAELEQALAVALFTRSPRGLLPTEAARELEPHARAMALAANALVRAASGEAGAARGTVRITASEIIGAEVLPKILANFRERHPAVTIELVLSNRPEDLLRREVVSRSGCYVRTRPLKSLTFRSRDGLDQRSLQRYRTVHRCNVSSLSLHFCPHRSDLKPPTAGGDFGCAMTQKRGVVLSNLRPDLKTPLEQTLTQRAL